jgi:hypothetical protein
MCWRWDGGGSEDGAVCCFDVVACWRIMDLLVVRVLHVFDMGVAIMCRMWGKTKEPLQFDRTLRLKLSLFTEIISNTGIE